MNDKTSLAEKIFGHRGLKLLLFLFSYMLAVLIAGIIIGGGQIGEYILGLYLFPLGFGWSIFNANFPEGEITIILGWLSYLIITIWAIVTKNNRIAKILYLIFAILLILNIGGCSVGEMIAVF